MYRSKSPSYSVDRRTVSSVVDYLVKQHIAESRIISSKREEGSKMERITVVVEAGIPVSDERVRLYDDSLYLDC
jgi:enoyl reductase-like protein